MSGFTFIFTRTCNILLTMTNTFYVFGWDVEDGFLVNAWLLNSIEEIWPFIIIIIVTIYVCIRKIICTVIILIMLLELKIIFSSLFTVVKTSGYV